MSGGRPVGIVFALEHLSDSFGVHMCNGRDNLSGNGEWVNLYIAFIHLSVCLHVHFGMSMSLCVYFNQEICEEEQVCLNWHACNCAPGWQFLEDECQCKTSRMPLCASVSVSVYMCTQNQITVRNQVKIGNKKNVFLSWELYTVVYYGFFQPAFIFL